MGFPSPYLSLGFDHGCVLPTALKKQIIHLQIHQRGFGASQGSNGCLFLEFKHHRLGCKLSFLVMFKGNYLWSPVSFNPQTKHSLLRVSSFSSFVNQQEGLFPARGSRQLPSFRVFLLGLPSRFLDLPSFPFSTKINNSLGFPRPEAFKGFLPFLWVPSKTHNWSRIREERAQLHGPGRPRQKWRVFWGVSGKIRVAPHATRSIGTYLGVPFLGIGLPTLGGESNRKGVPSTNGTDLHLFVQSWVKGRVRSCGGTPRRLVQP